MGRGLGERQRNILQHLEDNGGAAFVSDLCTDPDDQNERKYVLTALKGLERRGLVHTERRGNPDRTPVEYPGAVNGFSGVEVYTIYREANETFARLADVDRLSQEWFDRLYGL